ncbi:3-keto-5-aminohexanoate cleavage protein [Variovorax sp. RT4R15]|uniref:3-keto-5-aminohexanoate cleavage protein n=1 Tax=Variovorax sp. RT4R15 TaxID=3443737 RepID=UPI003F45B10A
MVGNVRVRLEDSLLIGRGQLAGSNAEQVLKVRRMLQDHGLEIARPTEARAMLAPKGPDRTRF